MGHSETRDRGERGTGVWVVSEVWVDGRTDGRTVARTDGRTVDAHYGEYGVDLSRLSAEIGPGEQGSPCTKKSLEFSVK